MSNPIENANKLGNQLFEIQTETLTKLTEVQQQNLERFMQSSREYSERMSQVTDPQGFAELQREAWCVELLCDEESNLGYNGTMLE